MVLNLSYDIEDFYKFQGNFVNQNILDVTGILSALPDQSHIIYARRIDKEHHIEKSALKKYIDTIGKISKAEINSKNIRDYKIAGIPIFWLTSLAEKHDSYHWGQTVFFLLKLTTQQSQLFQNEASIKVILPKGAQNSKNLIDNIFKNYNLKLTYFNFAKTSCNVLFLKELIHFWINYLVTIPKLKKKLFFKVVEKNKNSNVFISKSITKDIDLDVYYNESKKINLHSTYYVPFLCNISNYLDFNWESSDKYYLKVIPSFRQVSILSISIIFLYLKLSIKRNRIILNKDILIDFNLLREEMKLSLISITNYFNLLWLTNYFKEVKVPTKIFYSDEFYISGRIISYSITASNNKLLSSNGIQHGLITQNHTVYAITNDELTSTNTEIVDSIPKPNNFIVWGNHFKELFLSNNDLDSNYVIVAGNLKHCRSNFLKNKVTSKIETLKILWCTTLAYHAKCEYLIMKDTLLKLENYQVHIRMHPLHDIKTTISNIIDPSLKKSFIYTNNAELSEDFKDCNLVVTTASSTVFLDSLLEGKITLRISSDMAITDSYSNIRLLHEIYTSADFYDVICKISDFTLLEENDLTEISCKDNVSNWKKIINHNAENL